MSRARAIGLEKIFATHLYEFARKATDSYNYQTETLLRVNRILC